MKPNKVIIAFTARSNKFWARAFCKNFRHCCIIFETGHKHLLIQIAVDGVRVIPISPQTLTRMQQDGWTMVKTTTKTNRQVYPQILTCVGFAKRALGIRAPFIWTPDGLYRRIVNSNQ